MRDDFYGNLNIDPTTSHGAFALRATTVHYQAAWTLVHVLLSDPAYAPAFRDYLNRLHAGTREADAWRDTVGDLGDEALEAAYHAALVVPEVTVLRTKFTPPAFAPPEQHPMAPPEVHVLWARLRDWTREDGRAGVTADLSAVAGEHDAQTVILRALWAAQSGGEQAAEKIVREGLVGAPHEKSF